jgi:curved DNA-binding protein CbpA
VLQLKPGAGAAALRRRYREMAVALHPDKCKVRARAAPCRTAEHRRMVHLAFNSYCY